MASEHDDLPALCSALIDLANARGGPDNITVVAARFEGEGLPEADRNRRRRAPALSAVARHDRPPETTAPAPADAADGRCARDRDADASGTIEPTPPNLIRYRGLHSDHPGRAPAAARGVAVSSPQHNDSSGEAAGVDAPLRTRLAWLAALSFASGFPFGLVNETLPVYLRTHGAGLVEIGLISALSFPWTFKFLWAPLVDRVGSRRQWIVGCLAGLTLLTLVLGTTELGELARWFWLILVLMVTLSATQDVAIDAYTIEATTTRELGVANSVRIAAYRVAMFTAGGLLIWLAGRQGWPMLVSHRRHPDGRAYRRRRSSFPSPSARRGRSSVHLGAAAGAALPGRASGPSRSSPCCSRSTSTPWSR